MNPTEKNQPQDEEVLKNQEAAEAAIDEETQKEATEELNARREGEQGIGGSSENNRRAA